MSNGKPLLRLDDQIEERVQAIRTERDWWPCQRRCDYCCHHLAHPPELSPAEWERVDEAVASLPDSIRAGVEQKIDALLQHLVEQNANSPTVCPYLDEQEGACRIYDARPSPAGPMTSLLPVIRTGTVTRSRLRSTIGEMMRSCGVMQRPFAMTFNS